jgi:hypothetical protein
MNYNETYERVMAPRHQKAAVSVKRFRVQFMAIDS